MISHSPITTKAVLLQALADGPGYGRSLIARVLEDYGLVLHMGSVYPALLCLDDDGLIKVKRGMGGEDRSIWYELTKKGERLVEEHKLLVLKMFMKSKPKVTYEDSLY
jgi:DNA-binding PadR family transcriptional regulator